MNFLEIAQTRQSCRAYDEHRPVEQERLDAVLEAARLAPSACNAQPYHLTVCRGEAAKAAAKACSGLGMNKFASQAPVLIVISEQPYSKSAAMGAKVKGITHVGIYVGNNMMIHAGDPVGFADLRDEQWAKKIYAFGRLPIN